MENKYDRAFWKFEQKHKQKGKEIDKMLGEKFVLKTRNNKNYGKDYLDSICLNFHLFDNDLKDWVTNEVLPHFEDNTLISCFLIKLTDALMLDDTKKINSIMKSFKAIKFINDIKLKGNTIILVTKNNEEIKLKNLFNNEKERNEFRSRCHSGCEFLIKNQEIFAKDSAIITLRDRYIGKYPLYHSVILSKDKYIVDPARNMIMLKEDYKRLFNPDVIMIVAKEKMLKEIKLLEKKDNDFNNSNLSNVLKLAINRQINHKN